MVIPSLITQPNPIKQLSQTVECPPNIAFDDIIQLSDYLDESDISINDLQFFSPDDIKKSVVSKACIKSLKNVPVFYGFTNAMQCCEQLKKYYKVDMAS